MTKTSDRFCGKALFYQLGQNSIQICIIVLRCSTLLFYIIWTAPIDVNTFKICLSSMGNLSYRSADSILLKLDTTMWIWKKNVILRWNVKIIWIVCNPKRISPFQYSGSLILSCSNRPNMISPKYIHRSTITRSTRCQKIFILEHHDFHKCYTKCLIPIPRTTE